MIGGAGVAEVQGEPMEDHDDEGAMRPVTRPGGPLLGAVLAALATAGMVAAAASLLPTTRSSDGAEALIGMVLAGSAVLGALLCLYLMMIWSLAGLVLIAGPASRTGRTLLAALRVVAPRVARRITVGAALATAATGLALGPALAASPTSTHDAPPPALQVAAELRPTAPVEEDEAPPADTPPPTTAPAEEGDPADQPLPPLGWETRPSAPDEETAAPAAPETTPAPPAGTPTEDGTDSGNSPEEAAPAAGIPAAQDAPRPAAESAPPSSSAPSTSRPGSSAPTGDETVTITVSAGDTLWSLTDDLLGPGPDRAEDIAAAWPLLYDLNRDRIGPDPELIRPGQELIVPTSLASQEH